MVFSKILEKIDSIPNFDLNQLGDIGKKIILLKNCRHSELDSCFFENSDLKNLCDLIDLIEYSNKKNICFFEDFIFSISQSCLSNKFKNSKTPIGNASFARFLKKSIREKARKTRKIQFVKSKNFIDSLRLNWDCIPSNFLSFKKNKKSDDNNSIFNHAISKFNDIGCCNLANSCSEISKRFYSPEALFEYKKIKILDACMILAKLNNCVLDDQNVLIKTDSGWGSYRSVVVPIHNIDSFPNKLKKYINKAENFKELFFDPVFDNYSVIFPFSDLDFSESNIDIDKLVNSKNKSALVGERDGISYFIC